MWKLYSTLYTVASNTIYICRHCWYKTHPHISAHNFLNIQPIFNLQKVMESWDWGLCNQILYMSTLLIQVMAFYTKYNTLNAMHVNTVDTVEKPWYWAFQNFKRIENWLNIKEVMSQNVLVMSTLLIQLKSPDSVLSKTFLGLKIGWILRKLWTEMYVEYVRATNTSVFVSTVSTNNKAYTIQCIACFDLCVDSVDKKYSIHNT